MPLRRWRVGGRRCWCVSRRWCGRGRGCAGGRWYRARCRRWCRWTRRRCARRRRCCGGREWCLRWHRGARGWRRGAWPCGDGWCLRVGGCRRNETSIRHVSRCGQRLQSRSVPTGLTPNASHQAKCDKSKDNNHDSRKSDEQSRPARHTRSDCRVGGGRQRELIKLIPPHLPPAKAVWRRWDISVGARPISPVLWNTTLKSTVLWSAILWGAKLWGAVRWGARLRGAILWDTWVAARYSQVSRRKSHHAPCSAF